MFQSTPSRWTGRILLCNSLAVMPICFNPRPVVGLGESRRLPAFAPRLSCFNPRPVVGLGESLYK